MEHNAEEQIIKTITQGYWLDLVSSLALVSFLDLARQCAAEQEVSVEDYVDKLLTDWARSMRRKISAKTHGLTEAEREALWPLEMDHEDVTLILHEAVERTRKECFSRLIGRDYDEK
jgi:hypothetical protein